MSNYRRVIVARYDAVSVDGNGELLERLAAPLEANVAEGAQRQEHLEEAAVAEQRHVLVGMLGEQAAHFVHIFGVVLVRHAHDAVRAVVVLLADNGARVPAIGHVQVAAVEQRHARTAAAHRHVHGLLVELHARGWTRQRLEADVLVELDKGVLEHLADVHLQLRVAHALLHDVRLQQLVGIRSQRLAMQQPELRRARVRVRRLVRGPQSEVAAAVRVALLGRGRAQLELLLELTRAQEVERNVVEEALRDRVGAVRTAVAVEHAEQVDVGVERLGVRLAVLGRLVGAQVVALVELDGALGLDVHGGLVGAQYGARLGRTEQQRRAVAAGRASAAAVVATRAREAECVTRVEMIAVRARCHR